MLCEVFDVVRDEHVKLHFLCSAAGFFESDSEVAAGHTCSNAFAEISVITSAEACGDGCVCQSYLARGLTNLDFQCARMG